VSAPRLSAAAAALTLSSLLVLSASAPARPRPAPRAAAASTHLQVAEVEYRLILSHSTISAGALDLQALDRGQDPHDLRIRAVGSRGEIAAPLLRPGQHWNAVVHLKPGTYRLWCSLPEHARLGMHTTLTVVR
jgi:hypothetical protein